jgi:hypothetical protein
VFVRYIHTYSLRSGIPSIEESFLLTRSFVTCNVLLGTTDFQVAMKRQWALALSNNKTPVKNVKNKNEKTNNLGNKLYVTKHETEILQNLLICSEDRGENINALG